MGSSKSGGSTTVGYRYYMTLQMVFGRGPIDEVVEIKVGDKTAWPFREGESTAYDSTITDDTVTNIEAPSLFGGDKSEGGIQGTLTWRMGKATQVYPQWFKNLLGGEVPDFRGVVSAVFDGLICSLNPYPKTWKVRLRRATKGWDGEVWHPELAVITLTADSGQTDDEESTTTEATDYTIKAMNGAHILYQCVTDRSWGRGYDRARIDETSWLATAQKLYDEGFGLCIAWKRQDTLEAFVGQVVKHIGATMFVSRETGLLELRLIRDDYNPDTIPHFTYDSGLLALSDPETATLADAVGEVIVKYHDPATDKDLQVRAQNLAVIQSGEGINSQNVSYQGLPTQALASRVALRDLKAQSAETSRYKVKLDRRAWRIYPGAVFKVSAPDKGISNLILRAGSVEDTVLTDGTINVEAVIDVYGLPSVAFTEAPDSGYVKPDKTPGVITQRIVREATYQEIAARTSQADRQFIEVTDAGIATIAARPKPTNLNYAILTKLDSEEYVERNNETFAPVAKLLTTVGHYETAFSFYGAADIGLVTVGMLAQINNELVRVDEITINEAGDTGTITVTRGTVDTLPAAHAADSLIFFLGENVGTDFREYAMGEDVYIRLLSNASGSQLPFSDAPEDVVTMVARQGKPYPPGDVRIDSAPAFGVTSVGASFTVAWTHRDRLLQVDQIVGHGDASVGPEAGTTYRLRFYNASGTLLKTVSGISGTSRSFTSADTDIVGALTMKLDSQRDGYSSLYAYEFGFTRTI